MGLARVNEIQQTNEGILGNALERTGSDSFFSLRGLFITERLIRFN